MTAATSSVVAALIVAGWSAVTLSAVACAEHPEFMLGMDDEVTFQRVQEAQELPLAEALWSAMNFADASVSLGVYEPGTFVFRTLLARVAGPSARTFAMAGVLLHGLVVALACGNAMLIMRHCHGMPSTSTWFSPAMAAAFMGAHPMRAEVVCWPSCHGYLLATIFCLLSLRCSLLRWRLWEWVLIGMALLCKAAAVTFPLVIGALQVAQKLRTKGSAYEAASAGFPVRYCPLILACVASALHASGQAPADVRSLTTVESWLRGAFVPCFYLWRSFVEPCHWTTPRLAVPEVLSMAEPCYMALVIFVCSATLVPPAYWLCRAWHLSWCWQLWLVWLAYLALLLPTVASSHVWALAADRYVYIPSLCLFTPCLALLLSTLEAQLGRALRTVLKVAFACAILACSWRAHEVSSFWSHGSLHLFQAILKEQPGEFHTLKDLGTLQLKKGQMSQARSTLSEALRLRPNHGGVLLNLATLEHQLKHPTKAEGMYRRAVRAVEADVKRCGNCQPSMTELAKVQANYGGLLLQLGRAQEATTVLEAGAPWDAAVESARAPGLYHLCLAYRALGRRERATLFCRASLAAKGTAAVEAMLADLETDVEVDGLR